MAWLSPSFEGELSVERLADDLLERLGRRVESGLFPAASAVRNRYEVVSQSRSALRFRSTNLLTGINVGLNDVRVEVSPRRDMLRYQGSYWVWTRYCVLLAASLMLVPGAVVMAPLFGVFVFPESLYPPLWQMAVFGLPMVLFWGVAWPWLLVALHRKHAARCLVNLLREVNDQPATTR